MKNRYFWMKSISIASAGCIPFFAGFSNKINYFSYIAAFLGSIVVIIEGIISLFNYKEKYLIYRIKAEQLKREKYLFLTNTEPYDNIDNEINFKLLVFNCERLLEDENKSWKIIIEKTGKRDNIDEQ